MNKPFLLILPLIAVSVISCDKDDSKQDDPKDVSITSFADVQSCHSVILKGYANGANGKVGFCYSMTNTDPKPETCSYVTTSSINTDNSYEITVNELKPNTKYYYRAFATKDLMKVLAKDVKTFTTDEFSAECIDLGLPSGLKWANCNLGATTPEECGDYFAWGETEPKFEYNFGTYFDTFDGGKTFNKYNNEFGKAILEPEDDAAVVNWGGSWRIPTIDELNELSDNCSWTWTSLNDMFGYRVVGSNGNSIFLPAAGCRYDLTIDRVGLHGYYMSSSLYTENSNSAFNLHIYSGKHYEYHNIRLYGFSVRPVCY